MKHKFNSLIIGGLLVLGSAGAVQAQLPSADLQVNASLSGGMPAGTYAGVGYAGSLDIIFNNNAFTTVPALAFDIIVTVPSGLQLAAVYAAPAGWVYVRTNAQLARLTPVSPAAATALAQEYFQVPFTTVQVTSPILFTAAQIVNRVPSTYEDPVAGNNFGQTTVTVGNTPLPVQFASFEAKASGCDVVLNWITSSEQANAYFTVERSADGIKFEAIDKVATQGNGVSPRRYNFVDANPYSGKSFYRVAQVDIDGTSTATNVESVSVNCAVNTIELFPNPATAYVRVKGMQNGKNSIRILNIAGQLMTEKTAEAAEQQINIEKFAAGTYQVQVLNNDKVVYTGKFVKGK